MNSFVLPRQPSRPAVAAPTGLMWLAALAIGLVVLLWVAGSRRQHERNSKKSKSSSSQQDTPQQQPVGAPMSTTTVQKSKRVQFQEDTVVEYDPDAAPTDTPRQKQQRQKKDAHQPNDDDDEDITIVDGIRVTQPGRSRPAASDSASAFIACTSASSSIEHGGTNITTDDAFSYIDMPPEPDALKKHGTMPRSYYDKAYGDKVREENKDFVDLPPLPTHEEHMKAVRRMPAKQMLSGRMPSFARTKGASTNIRDMYQPLPPRKTSGLALHGMTESYFAHLNDPANNSGDQIADLMGVESAFV